MRRIVLTLVCIIAIATLSACSRGSLVSRGALVLNVVLQSEDPTVEDYKYIAVYEHGTDTIDPFVPDSDASFYQAAFGTFSDDIVDGEIVNTLENTQLIDEYDNTIDADQTMMAMLQKIADTVDHSIWRLTLVTDQERYFAYVELNVNWHSPGILYEYDVQSDELIKLYGFESYILVGIQLP